jgi:translocation and assembly module TamB
MDDLALSGAEIAVTGHGELAGEQVAGTMRLELPRLAALSQAMGTPLAGSVIVVAGVDGRRDQPGATIEADGADIDVGGHQAARVSVTGRFDGPLAAPRGTLDARGELRTPAGIMRAASLRTRYALTDGTLTLPDLTVNVDRDRITGNVAVALRERLTSGKLEGELPDLSLLASLAGTDLAGAGRFTVTLVSQGGRQDGALSAELTDLRVNGVGSVGRAVLTADVRDALGSATLKSRLEATSAATSGADITRFTATLDGTLDRAGFGLDAEVGCASRSPRASPAVMSARTPTGLCASIVGRTCRSALLVLHPPRSGLRMSP